MTKQSITVMKQGFMVGKKRFVRNTLGMALGLVLMAFTGGKLPAVTLDAQVQRIEWKLNQSTITVSLNYYVPGGSIDLDMNTTFIAEYPEAFMGAQLDATGTQLMVVLVDAPQSGDHTVGEINIFDEGDVLVGVARVSINDGIVAVDMADL